MLRAASTIRPASNHRFDSLHTCKMEATPGSAETSATLVVAIGCMRRLPARHDVLDIKDGLKVRIARR